MNKLKSLRFSGNDVVSIAPLAEHTALEELKFSNNKVEDVSVVSAYKNLGTAELEGNKVFDFSPFAGIKALFSLVITGQKLEYKGEAVEVSSYITEMDSPVKGLETIGATNIKVVSSDGNITVSFENDKLRLVFNEKAYEEIRNNHEKKLDLTFSFKNEKDFKNFTLDENEPNNSITVKGIVLK